jgi:hypothetical protein
LQHRWRWQSQIQNQARLLETSDSLVVYGAMILFKVSPNPFQRF